MVLDDGFCPPQAVFMVNVFNGGQVGTFDLLGCHHMLECFYSLMWTNCHATLRCSCEYALSGAAVKVQGLGEIVRCGCQGI